MALYIIKVNDRIIIKYIITQVIIMTVIDWLFIIVPCVLLILIILAKFITPIIESFLIVIKFVKDTIKTIKSKKEHK